MWLGWPYRLSNDRDHFTQSPSQLNTARLINICQVLISILVSSSKNTVGKLRHYPNLGLCYMLHVQLAHTHFHYYYPLVTYMYTGTLLLNWPLTNYSLCLWHLGYVNLATQEHSLGFVLLSCMFHKNAY